MRLKVNRNEYLDMVTQSLPLITDEETKQRYKLSASDVRVVYDTFMDQAKNIICSGKDLSLTGLGSFSLKKHKGHPVQFEADENSVSDYVVLKFTVSDVLMSSIRKAYNNGLINLSEH